MTPETAFRTYLVSKESITSLVGNRIYFGIIPQDAPLSSVTFPVIVYNLLSSEHDHWLRSGAGGVVCRFQVDVYAIDYEDCETIGEALRQALQMYSGAAGDLEITSVLLDGEFSIAEPAVDASDVSTWRKSQDYLVKFRISIPNP